MDGYTFPSEATLKCYHKLGAGVCAFFEKQGLILNGQFEFCEAFTSLA